MIRIIRFAFAITLIVLGLLFGWIEISRLRAIDDCLSAGGSFNYASGACDFVTSHPSSKVLSDVVLKIVIAQVLVVAGLVVLPGRPWFGENR